MKKLVPATWLAFFSLLFFSCSKNNGPYAFVPEEIPAKLEAHIYPVVTSNNGAIALGKEQSSLAVGETVTLFLPYRMVADDIQYARLYISDAVTGDVVRELEMTFSTDLSVINIAVPEEIQGSSFMFVNMPVDADLAGKWFNISAKLEAYKLRTDDNLNNAFNVQ